MTQNKPTLIALCGKSASGKDTVAKWLEKIPSMAGKSIHRTISATTRPPREGELDGINYHFLTLEQFVERAENGEMLEWAKFRGWYYGTLEEELVPQSINLSIFNAKGIHSLVKFDDKYNIIPVYITCSLGQRLERSRGREGHWRPEHFRRVLADYKDFRNIKDYFKLFSNEPIIVDSTDKGAFDVSLDIVNYLSSKYITQL